MPLLDGKYEILSERALAHGATRFEATSPQGERVRVDWYDVAAGDEAAFERYRRLLKALARAGDAAVLDVVSRPGARYVAWRIAPPDLPAATAAPITEAIVAAGLDPARADLRRDGRAVQLFDLPFGAGSAAGRSVTPVPMAEGAERAPRTLAARFRRVRLGDDAVAWAVTTCLLLLATAAFATGFAARANDRLVYVPELVGASVHGAAERLAALGLRVESVAVASDDAVGEVLALDPAAGAALRPGRSVRLTYAVSPGRLAPVTVPELVGLGDVDTAVVELEVAGLVLGRVARVHADAPPGTVLAQSVPPGNGLGQGQRIDLLTSLGPRPETTFLPGLVGLDVEDARYLATVAGLTEEQIVIEYVPSDRGAAGSVVSQSLAPFARVPRSAATLRLLVVAEPTATRVPTGLTSLAGLSLERARSLAPGFDVRVEEIEDRNLPDGVVLQSLPLGAEPGAGPLVLTVNARPVPVPRPDVVAELRAPEERQVEFMWLIEPGIPEQRAEVRARTLQGDDVLVVRRQVRGGDLLRGTWTTAAPGPVRFTLTLNDQPYGGDLLIP
ncbi:hypothetical protein BH23DEI1_BH23DEI1_18940 [soil metagenome]